MDDKRIINKNLALAHAEFENSFRSGLAKFTEGINEMALSLHDMQRFGSWRVIINLNTNEIFRTWSEYIVWLADDAGLGRSTIFKYKSALEFARANQYIDGGEDGEVDFDQFRERGGVLTFDRIKSKTVTDKNGVVVAIKGVDVENPAEIIGEIVNTIDPESRPMDQVRYIKEVIDAQSGMADKVEINLRLRRNQDGGYDLVWTKEVGIGYEEGLVSYPVPDDVFAVLKSDFHILV